MKKWSSVVFSIWLIFFSIIIHNYLLYQSKQYEYVILLLITSLIYFLLIMFETIRKQK